MSSAGQLFLFPPLLFPLRDFSCFLLCGQPAICGVACVTWWNSQRINQLPMAAVITLAGLPRIFIESANCDQRWSQRLSRLAASINVLRSCRLPALINPASACRLPLEAFLGVSPQNRANCHAHLHRTAVVVQANKN